MNLQENATRSSGLDLYHSIRHAIISLQFAPGQLLSENELAGRFQTSRTPVRDALKLLEREGLVRISSRRKTMVAPLDLNAYRQAVFAREALESAAAREAALEFRKGDRKLLTENVEKQAAAIREGAVWNFDTLDFTFHHAVFQIARLEALSPVVDSFRGLTDRMRTAHLTLLTQYDHSSVVEQHAGIADAIERGDADCAPILMGKHVLSVMERVARLARERPEYFGNVPAGDVERLERSLLRLSDSGGSKYSTQVEKISKQEIQ
jgi:GntR family transcriptional regulator, rspAB operon transcriptional repressor